MPGNGKARVGRNFITNFFNKYQKAGERETKTASCLLVCRFLAPAQQTLTNLGTDINILKLPSDIQEERRVESYVWTKDVKPLENLFDESDASLPVAENALRVAVCDAEGPMRDQLEERVREMLPDAVTESFSSGKELLESGTEADILLLDIQMPGMDGLEAARQFRQKRKDALILFVTAAPEYVFEAFDVGAFHYLVKPLSEERFREVFGKAVREAERRKRKGGETGERYMMVQSGGVHTKVLFRDIVYAEVFGRKVIIHTRSGDTEYYGRLSELEQKAGADFFRPHRSYLIHFSFVRKYDAKTIVLERGTVPVAKQNYPEFVRRYLQYNRTKGREIR